MTKVNRTYKDRLFRLLFNSKKELLSLYNAINGSNYTDTEALEVTTLEDAIYMGMKNDLSFLLDEILNLYEHQSTFNPNMPVRGLLYLSDVYRKYIEDKKLNLLSRKLVKLPLPRYIIFYNGLKEEPDRLELKLSDAFLGDGIAESCLEFKALLLNINLGHNQGLMEKCGELRGYAIFVASVRGYLDRKMSLEAAVNCAVEECISKGILSKFLAKHRAEVQDLILQEYNEQEHIEMERAEARLEGREEGIQALILDNLEEGTPKERIIHKISRRFLLGKEEAAVFYEKYAVDYQRQI